MEYKKTEEKVGTIVNEWLNKMLILMGLYQRPLAWSAVSIAKFFNALIDGTDIGTVTLHRIIDHKLIQVKNLTGERIKVQGPTNKYLLIDGQQRITALYALFNCTEVGKINKVYWNAVTCRFVTKRNKYCISALEFFNHDIPRSGGVRENLIVAREKILDRTVTFTTYDDVTYNEGIELFESINRSGKPLSTVNLFAAATNTFTFSFYDEAGKIQELSEALGFGHIDHGIILQMITAVAYQGLSDGKAKKFCGNEDKLVESFDIVKVSLRKSISYLNRYCHIYSIEDIPYSFQLIGIVAFFSDVKTINPKQAETLKKWLLKAAFAERYQGASTTIWEGDLENIQKLAANEPQKLLEFELNMDEQKLFEAKYIKGSAIVKGLTLLLKENRPCSVSTGIPVFSKTVTSSSEYVEYHHIFPKKYLKNVGKEEEIHRLMNITVLNKDDNGNISSTAPAHSFDTIRNNLGESYGKVLAGHFLNIDNEIFKTNDYERFLWSRAELISETLNKYLIA